MRQILKEMSPFNVIWLGIIILIAVTLGVLSFSYVDLSVFSLDTLFYALCLLNVANVTFEPGCRNNWHIHHKGGQILLCTDGEGWCQEFKKKARKLSPGDVVYIAPEVKHWHGASKDSWFTHVSIEVPAKNE